MSDDVKQVLHLPVISLESIDMRVDTLPTGEKMLVIGPLAFAVPLSGDTERWLRDQLNPSGLLVPPPGSVIRGL